MFNHHLVLNFILILAIRVIILGYILDFFVHKCIFKGFFFMFLDHLIPSPNYQLSFIIIKI